MENRQNKPPEGEAASGHGGQKFYTDSEQAKLHKSKLRMQRSHTLTRRSMFNE